MTVETLRVANVLFQIRHICVIFTHLKLWIVVATQKVDKNLNFPNSRFKIKLYCQFIKSAWYSFINCGGTISEPFIMLI